MTNVQQTKSDPSFGPISQPLPPPASTGNILNNNNNNGSNGNGLSGSFTDKDSLTPSPPQRLSSDDVKSEPMDMVCGTGGGASAATSGVGGPAGLSLAGLAGLGVGVAGSASTNLASDDHSNDSSGENDPKYMGLGGDGKGSLR